MRISISNIAWDVADDEAIAALLGRMRIDAIDVAPGKYFPDPARASPGEIERVRCWWADRGIDIVGMQALLFGTSGLNLFGPPASREAMLERLAVVCRIGAGLGATRLTFGSPRNRDRSGLTDARAAAIAVEFFRQLGEHAARHGVVVCLEPNPVRYGCNFMTTTEAAAQIVRACDHPAVRVQLDTGTVAINGEDAAVLLARHADVVGHVHASEPDLVTLGEGGADHARAADALRRHLPDSCVTVEMLAARGEAATATVARALQVARRYYGPAAAAAAG